MLALNLTVRVFCGRPVDTLALNAFHGKYRTFPIAVSWFDAISVAEAEFAKIARCFSLQC